jgi:serine/threonine protein kinase
MVGDTVGKYRILARLGRGGMGTVYKGVDETLGREVAIKSLNADVTDASLLKRFRAEAVALAHLNHPNIATLFELTEHEGQLLMIMEFVRGDTLDRVAQHSGGMPIERASRLALQVLDALGHAHRAGIVHRDLKPANLMLTESGLVKVMDFGLARMVGTEHLTNDGFMVGTPAYMSPEQVLGREIDGRTDLYAMGVVLHRLLTGQLPFTAESGIAMVQKQINDAPMPLRQVRPDLPDAAQDVLTRALAKSADDRYQTADEFKSALMPFVGNLSAADMPLPSGIVAALSGISRMSEHAVAAAGAKAPALESNLPSVSAPLAVSNADPAPATKLLPRSGSGSGTATSNVRLAATIAGAVALLVLVGVPAGIIIMRRGAPPPSVSGDQSATPIAPSPSSRSGSLGGTPPPTAARDLPEERAGARPPAEHADLRKSLAAARARMPVVTFDQVKVLEIDRDGKPHDRDASLRLGGDRVDLLDGTTALQSVRYADLVDVFHSHSREPRWTDPDGTTVFVTRVGGTFGFLRGADDWITLRTKKSFVAVRVQPEELPRVVSELQARTGRHVVQAR